VRALGALEPRSPRAVRACDGTVARSTAAQWWLAGGKVLSESSRGPQGGCRATRSGAELTRAARGAWRQWRMLRAAAFNGGEAAPVMDDIGGVALQC
jgi:hypothetical protein